MSIRSFCIHAHFYQPPREDPLTGIIPREPGASPFPNWNERIHAECYRPNAELENFKHISFNVGPTLFSWMVGYDPKTYENILAQDGENIRKFGVGNAIAQAYNHTILPLTSSRDKITQVYWGSVDFEHRFGRKPQGMWLPETAVDTETLSVLADQGIEFTILAAWQADRKNLDVTEPYRVLLPSGKQITVFFYHPELSGGLSFSPSLSVNADTFALKSLAPHFRVDKAQRGEPQILLLASDGELYGHHQPLRDYFLTHLVNGASSQLGLASTYPGLWLIDYPVNKTVEIRENTSWSCHHGVARWSGSCACTPGDPRWKASLWYAFDRLSTALDDLYERFIQPHVPDAWMLRNRYIYSMLGLIPVDELINESAGRRLPAEVRVRTHLLLEAQRERQRMYTSCGWFFDDFDRIEPKNNVAYAAQAVRLIRMATGVDLEPNVLDDLKRVVSQRTGLSASSVFVHHMKRAVLDGRVIAGD